MASHVSLCRRRAFLAGAALACRSAHARQSQLVELGSSRLAEALPANGSSSRRLLGDERARQLEVEAAMRFSADVEPALPLHGLGLKDTALVGIALWLQTAADMHRHGSEQVAGDVLSSLLGTRAGLAGICLDIPIGFVPLIWHSQTVRPSWPRLVADAYSTDVPQLERLTEMLLAGITTTFGGTPHLWPEFRSRYLQLRAEISMARAHTP
eukprot:CAMPEP_0177218338 /NCGR_PEP_ID=MMETSP0367-20130122/35762_1 /TAXON_ID=447022 ORGANISM="Scrippsiella hangoei-like, Strain SHHI-4" /NCGR_SAMPLE_ID=MMETSP0367 /ASSEMBLY_ACC=CAM_ASM_000362 /LENGTH=210 /DNA_ID=CAMNT_0018667963 /DNA_START=41 /DNA_END=671 /DNA_ORIENTATION=+